MLLIDNVLLQKIYDEAHLSDRKRSHYLLHTSHQEKVQRLLIAMVEGSYVEPHYHELANQWEMFVVMEGKVKVCLYGTDGKINQTFIVGPDTPVSVVEFAPKDIHSVECISSKALMMEIKEGPFDPNYAKVFPLW
ncbi:MULTISPECIES: WbuC family cupin fold metalloprotein [Xenorhabdus]|uniref:WbuC family cupin fold metalloprotein n=1 Tax=Xenorhabdus TaxID=626 RepID=UPI00064A3CCD|nr:MULTISPECIES: WbuC family cupin fold metalloprotein [Xenorhabdus]KLU15999.1 WbuC [Xenorhabdus griffiniae]KOP33898.1 WbuC [Xenorhabdus sp. GDc328]